jgi:ABC-type multidrug transport system ATPase subunit
MSWPVGVSEDERRHLFEWRDLTYSVGGKKKSTAKAVIAGTSGRARPGRLLGILGPSGSGKTTMLNILAGRIDSSRGTALSGAVTFGGEAWSQGGGMA